MSALQAGGVTPGNVLCQGMAFPQGTGCKRLQPGKGMASRLRQSRDHSKCHTLEHRGYVSYATEIQPLCSGADT